MFKTTVTFFAPRSLYLLCTLVILPFAAHAQSTVSNAGHSAAPVNESKVQFQRANNFQTFAELQYTTYINADKKYFFSDEKATEFTTVGVHFRQTGKTALDGRYLYSAAENEHYLDLREFSRKIEVPESYSLTMGRHLEDWSHADEFWQLGMWQPRFYWDKLRPEANGLVGAFYRPVAARKWNLMVFISPLYIPETGPNYKEEDGTIKSVNPWFRTPPPFLELFDQPTEITARVEEPEYSDVLLHPSIGFSTGKNISSEETVQWSYAYKPMNQLMMSFDYVLKPAAGDWTADFTFHPLVEYHHISTLGYHRKNDLWESDVSWTYDTPVLEERPVQEISQNRRDMHLYSATLSRNLAGAGRSATKLYGGVMSVDGYVAADRGENAQDTTLFEYAPIYFQAVKLGISRTQYRRIQDVQGQKTALEFVYDDKQKGGVVLAEYAVSPMQNMRMSFKADLIGVLSDEANEYEKGFLSSYRANDRLQMDVSYVF